MKSLTSIFDMGIHYRHLQLIYQYKNQEYEFGGCDIKRELGGGRGGDTISSVCSGR